MTTRSTKMRNAVIATMAGMALLVGGSTYALWSAEVTFEGGTITAGSMDIIAGTMNAWDVSPDRVNLSEDITTAASNDMSATTLKGTDKAALINLATWKIVPGDTVALVFPYKVTLEGDNLVAALTLPGLDSLLDASTFSTQAGKGLNFEYQIFDSTGTATAVKAVVPSQDFVASYFKPADSNKVVTFVLYVNFDSATADQAKASMSAVLKMATELSAKLEQVRCDSTTADKFAICD